MKFSLPPPKVRLVGAIKDPYNLSIATARTCYSSTGILSPEDVIKDEKAVRLRDKIAKSTLHAGHLTTRQHAHFVFALENVSRSLIWSFLHSHPFYNSEQVSQRYVKVKSDTTLIPAFEDAKAQKLYEETVRLQIDLYHQFIELLLEPASKEFYEIFPARGRKPNKWNSTIKKKCYEVARYILPLGTYAYLYHTINALTLLRYARMAGHFDTPSEQKNMIAQMLDEVKRFDPDFEKEIPDTLPLEESIEYKIFKSSENNFKTRQINIDEFDKSLEGMSSKLIDYKINAEKTVTSAVNSTLGTRLTEDEAIDLVLHPAKNLHLGDTLNVSSMSKLSRALFHVHYTFRKKISHSADSQDQRHRMTPASRPILESQYCGKADYITPKLIESSSEIEERYRTGMEKIFQNINTLLNMNVPFEAAHYLIPNAFPVRFEESGDLLSFHHKWKLRTCYNAQEEIFFSAIDELKQIKDVHPRLAKHILAPCYLRKEALIKPFCPEGNRYCGIPVWNQKLEEYKRVI
ncbi:MAG: thymidylate synthase [Deltaproteobacteria bacterium RIFCSPHIGHO2_12_FULL_43_9]|nr:MAG: thymidylate synthase [Deltaproteobacteria bacterium RIFCSPHIGHO2_12_FULL_43_9]